MVEINSLELIFLTKKKKVCVTQKNGMNNLKKRSILFIYEVKKV